MEKTMKDLRGKTPQSIDKDIESSDTLTESEKTSREENALNILFFSHSSGMAGAERSLLELVSELIKDHGCNCTVIVPSEGILSEKLQEVGAAIQVIPFRWWCTDASAKVNKEEAGKLLLQSYRALQKMLPSIKKIDPDVICTNSMVIPWGALTANILGKPHIWNIAEFGEKDHNFNFFYDLSQVVDFIDSMSDSIVTNSNAIFRELFSKKNKKKYQTIYYHIPTLEVITTLPESQKIFKNENAFHLIITGTVIPSKGQEDAVRSTVELIKNRQRSIELCIVGPGNEEYMVHLKEIVHENELEDLVHFIPFREDVLSLVNSSDCVLVCSKMEAFGRVTLEGLLLGKPVITTNTGGSPEIITHGENGFLYSPGNYQELADLVERLMDRPDIAANFAQKAIKFANETFTRESFGGRYFKHFLKNKQTGYEKKGIPNWFSQFLGATILSDDSMIMEDQEKQNLLNTIEELNQRIASLKVQILAYKEQVDGYEQQANDFKTTIRSQEKTLDHQKAFLVEKEALIQKADREIDRLNLVVKRKEKQLDQLSSETARYAASLSWRITRPLRKIRRLIRRILHVR